jgi:hypothetical protein
VGAIYHVLNRRDYRERIFKDDVRARSALRFYGFLTELSYITSNVLFHHDERFGNFAEDFLLKLS